jgi:hypothetical protein
MGTRLEGHRKRYAWGVVQPALVLLEGGSGGNLGVLVPLGSTASPCAGLAGGASRVAAGVAGETNRA